MAPGPLEALYEHSALVSRAFVFGSPRLSCVVVAIDPATSSSNGLLADLQGIARADERPAWEIPTRDR